MICLTNLDSFILDTQAEICLTPGADPIIGNLSLLSNKEKRGRQWLNKKS